MQQLSRREVLGGAAGVAAVTVTPGTAIAGGANPRAMRPVRLTTEHQHNPLGIDGAAPRFGWQLEASGRDRAQRAYRIMVASDADRLVGGRADVWDSGRVESPAQTALAYEGPTLRSRTRYFWAVDVWDESGRRGRRSDVAWFETALRSAGDWSAEWIGSGIVLPHPPRTLGPQGFSEVELEPGHTLGQTFRSESPLSAVVVAISAGAEPSGCVIALRRGGPDGDLLGRATLTGLTDGAQGRLDLPEPVESGALYLELSEPTGRIAWLSSSRDAYDGGTAYRDGLMDEANVDRYVDGIPPVQPPNPLLRTEFELPSDAKVRSARLYISGLGYAITWLNGQRVGDAELNPPCTDYDLRVPYTTHDVTAHLRAGVNAIGVALGRGFFATRSVDSDGTHLTPWVAEPQLKAQLEITLADGREVTVRTTPDWQVTEGPTTYDGLYTGESYDARRAAELDGWLLPGGGASDQWRSAAPARDPGGRMFAYAHEPIRAGAPVRPVEVTEPADGVRLYDFGAVMAGWIQFRGRLPEGVTVRVRYDEKLGPSGRIERGVPGGENNPSVIGRLHVDEYTAFGRSVESWHPSFTYKGFRYVEVSGTDGPLDVVAVPVQTDLTDSMELRVEQPVLQWIVDAARRTTGNAVHGLPDPSPMHTKFGWTGNAHFASQPMLYFFGMAGIFEKWLDDIRLSQTADGSLPIVTPAGRNWPPGLSPTWTGVYPHLVLRYWLTYGDPTIPRKHFDAVGKYAEWASAVVDLPYFDDHFADWLPPGYFQAPEGGRLVGLAYVVKSLREATALADLLGRTGEAAKWRARTAELVRRFNDEFLDPTAHLYRTGEEVGFRQTSQAVALTFDLVPADHVDAVAANLADAVAEAGRLDTGCAGISALPYALGDHAGRPDLAHLVLGKREYPSYGYLRDLGATTFWESWEPTSRGHNDTLWSSPVSWLVERVLGVETIDPGWARFKVAPSAFGDVPAAGMTLETVRGTVAVSWRRRGDEVELEVTVPVNAVAELVLPTGHREDLGSGRHRFVTNV